MKMTKKFGLIVLLLLVWVLLYINLQNIADFIVDSMLGLEKDTHITEAVRFFIFELPKVLLLLVLIIFVVGILRSYFSAEKTRKMLAGKPLFVGNIMAAGLGVLTPFCSCSAIPLFLGFVEAGVPIGVTFSFLIASPMINEVAIILLFGMFGWQVAVIYILSGLIIAILAGWIIGKLGLEKWVQDWVYKVQTNSEENTEEKLSYGDRISFGFTSVKDIVGKIWIYVAIGIAIGAGAHGFVPENFMASLMGKSAWYSVPLSVLIGIPMYSNAAGIVPIVAVLLEKGASLGTSLAFMMSVIALSLPEMIILKKVLKLPLILTFIGVVGFGIMLVGYIFNFIF